MGRVRRSGTWIAATLVLGCALAGNARAAPGLLFGFTDNLPLTVGAQATRQEAALGAGGTSYTLTWHPGETVLTPEDTSRLARGVVAAAGMRVILSIRTTAVGTPRTDIARDQFCDYARSAVESFPSINDIVIGNEPNSSFFWQPQYYGDGSSASPGAYEQLLADCYDVLHAYRPTIDVGAPATGPHGNDNPNAVSNVSHSPTSFILGLGAAYRASGRTERIFDTVVHHPYGDWNNERPYAMHPLPQSIGEGDWNRLVQTYQNAFAGTAQPVPGRCLAGSPCVPIWYLEFGFQTDVPPFDGYFGVENVVVIPDALIGEPASPSPPADSAAPDQATQLGYALRLAYCQPYVEAAFNFLLQDDANLTGYQSGLYRADGAPKAAAPALQAQVAALRSGAVSCAPPTTPTGLTTNVTPAGDVRLDWNRSSSSIGVSGYTVYRNGSAIGTSVAATFVDSDVHLGAQNSYAVRAFDAAGGTSGLSGSETRTVTLAAVANAKAASAAARSACVVPKVRGRRLAVAKRLLARAGCRIGRVHRKRTLPIRLAVVRKQSPRAGRHLRAGAAVSVTLGRRGRR